MLLLDASSLLIVGGIVLASWIVLLRGSASARMRERREEKLRAEVEKKIVALEELVQRARQESARLEAAIERAKALRTGPSPGPLALIESLGDPAALADLDRLPVASAQMPPAIGAAPDIFEADRQTLAIARLADQGRSPAEIAHQLGLPVGDVEFMLSLHSA